MFQCVGCYRERVYLLIAPAIHHKIYIPSSFTCVSARSLCRVFVIDSYRSFFKALALRKHECVYKEKSFHTPYHLKTQ